MTTVYEVVQKICLTLPETEEVVSHGFPNFKAAGKTFATYSVNHHGDGKVALLVNLSLDMQTVLVESAPTHFFVPPYSGSKGWVGVELNKGIQWDRVSQLACDAYCRVVPMALARLAVPVTVAPPTEPMKPEDIDPYLSRSNQTLLTRLKKICMALPEVSEARQFGAPCFKAGKKPSATCTNMKVGQKFRYGQVQIGRPRWCLLTNAIGSRPTSATTAGSVSISHTIHPGRR